MIGRTEVLAAAALLGSWAAVKSGASDAFDLRAGSSPRRGGTGVDRALAHATDLGSVYGLTGTAAALAVSGRTRMATDMLAAGGLAWVLGQSAKPLLDRPRPFESGTPRLVARPAGTSWPSGHSAVAAAMGTVVAANAPGSTRPAVTRGAGVALAAFVGGSRLHVGVHHPTDVVAGWGLGVLCARAWQRAAQLLQD